MNSTLGLQRSMIQSTPGVTPNSLFQRTYSNELTELQQARRNSAARESKLKGDIRKLYKEYLATKGKKPKNAQYLKDFCKRKRLKKANWSLCQSVMKEFEHPEQQTPPKLHFRVGSETKVFSPTKSQWNDGKVIKIKGKTFCVQFQYRSDELTRASIARFSVARKKKWVGIDQMAPVDADIDGLTLCDNISKQAECSSPVKDVDLPRLSMAEQENFEFVAECSSPAKYVEHVGHLHIGNAVEIHIDGQWVSGIVTRVRSDSVRVAFGKDLAFEKWVDTDPQHFREPVPPSPFKNLSAFKNIVISPTRTDSMMTPRSVASSCVSPFRDPFKPLPPNFPPSFPPMCVRTAPVSPNAMCLSRKNAGKMRSTASKDNLLLKLFQSLSPSPSKKLKKCVSDPEKRRYQAYVCPAASVATTLALSPPYRCPPRSAPSSPQKTPRQRIEISPNKSMLGVAGPAQASSRRANKKRGDLKIEVRCAMQLKRAANVATVSVAEYRLKTDTVSCTENPIWKETLIFNNFRPDQGKKGQITVLDKSSILGQTVVGSAEFRLLESLNVKKRMTLDLRDSKGKVSGIVVIGQTVAGRGK